MHERVQSPEVLAGGQASSLVQSCRFGSASACLQAGDTLQLGSVVPIDLPQAFDMYERGCTAGSRDACLRAADMAEQGRGVPASPELAERYRGRAERL